MDMGMSARMVGEREVEQLWGEKEQERLEKERQEEEKRTIAQKVEDKIMKCKEVILRNSLVLLCRGAW